MAEATAVSRVESFDVKAEVCHSSKGRVISLCGSRMRFPVRLPPLMLPKTRRKEAAWNLVIAWNTFRRNTKNS
jgi:hypothetical protein